MATRPDGVKTQTLEDLDDFRNDLADSMFVKECALHFMGVEPGSVAVTWALHSSLPASTEILRSALQLLEKKYGALRVIFQGECIPEPKSPEVRCL